MFFIGLISSPISCLPYLCTWLVYRDCRHLKVSREVTLPYLRHPLIQTLHSSQARLSWSWFAYAISLEERECRRYLSANCSPSLACLLILTLQFSSQLFTHPAFPQLFIPDLQPPSPPRQLPWETPPCQMWPVMSCDAISKGCVCWRQENSWAVNQNPVSRRPHSTTDAYHSSEPRNKL